MPTQTTSGPFNLTKATHYGRLIVKFGSIGLVALIVGRMLFTAFVAYWKATHPEPPAPPTVGFGRLPAISFPEVEYALPESYTLQIAKSAIPPFQDKIGVYFMPKPSLSLLGLEGAKQRAARLGFLFEPEALSSSVYRWTKTQPLVSSLELDIASNHFTLTTDFLSRPELLEEPLIPDQSQAVQTVKNFLKAADLLPADVASASGTVTYLKALGGTLKPAVSQSDADFVAVDINRVPIQTQYAMVTEDAETGTIHAILSGTGNQSADAVVSLQFIYYPIDYTQMHTYPLRDVNSAWELLQAGEGFVANPGTEETAVVRSISLAYYESFEYQPYLQPVYVFLGDNGFVGYVPAINPAYIQQ